MEVEGLLEVRWPNNAKTQDEVSAKVHSAKDTLLGEDWEQQPLTTSKHNTSIAHFKYWSRQGCNTVLCNDEAVEGSVGRRGNEAFLKMKYLLQMKRIFLLS